jgi:hypothetical protein
MGKRKNLSIGKAILKDIKVYLFHFPNEFIVLLYGKLIAASEILSFVKIII